MAGKGGWAIELDLDLDAEREKREMTAYDSCFR